MSRAQLNVSNSKDDQLDWMEEVKMQQDIILLEGDMMSTDEQSASTTSINVKSSHSSSHVQSMDTLDEPISETLLRDIKGIASKTRHILLPTSSSGAYKSVLKDWDLWGPLLLCTFMGLTLHHNGDGQVGPHFAEIFVLIWLGSYVVGLNYKLLSLAPTRRKQTGKSLLASPSIFQLLCVLGYCLVPPCAGIILLKAIESVFTLQMKHLLYEKLFVGTLLGFIWPTVSAVRILSRYQEQEKRLLAIYPIALFYFVISWFIISAH